MAAYLKTVRRQLPEGWKLPAGYLAGRGQGRLDVWDEHLSRSEILLNYFDLQTSNRRQPTELWHQCFSKTRPYSVALTHMNQTLWRLYLAGLIEWGPCFYSLHSYNQWDGVRLTPKGIAAAEKISVNLSGLISGCS